MPIKKPIIVVSDLNFSYRDNPVLEHVSFTLEKGDYVGIIGPNGGGKTTLLKILIGILHPQSGKILIEGIPISQFKQKSIIGYVPQRIAQDSAAFPATVYEVVESGRVASKKIFSRLDTKDKNKIKEVLKLAQIENLRDRLISQISGGERQRVYVARALAGDPKILILDEPFVGIDINAQRDFYAFLKKLNQKHGLTILFVSHDVDIISEEVKSVLCLNRGLLCFGSARILHEPGVIENLYGRKITHIHHSH